MRPIETPEAVTKEAAARFGDLANSAQERGNDPHAVAHFLVQVLFCLFAEDIGLLPNRIFSRLLNFARQTPAASSTAPSGTPTAGPPMNPPPRSGRTSSFASR